MKKNKKFLLSGILLIFIGITIGLIISSKFDFQTKGYSEDYQISRESQETLSKIGSAMAEVVQAVRPSVVNIYTTKKIKRPGIPFPFNDPFFRRFFDDEFERFFDRQREFTQTSLGSGVIVDSSGYILTNYHVIKGADEIKVKLYDKRVFDGTVIGFDAKTDIAVVKIKADGLRAIKWGDSDKLKVGETVIAIGNPYGLNLTVTSGIVSATGRANVGISDYEDFIQTDAAINPGNSGGPLVNVKGELVGINTAIFSTTGGYQGIGFAIPSNMARVVMDNLIKHKKVVRGWLGVTVQDIDTEMAKSLQMKELKGAVITDVHEGSPAEKAGLMRKDIIISFDGKEVEDSAHLRNLVVSTPPGKTVKLEIIRNGKVHSITATIGELPAEQKVSLSESVLAGIQVEELTTRLRNQLNIPKRINGVVVTSIDPDSPAEGLLTKGDVIIEINNQKINNVKDFMKVAGQVKNQAVVWFYRKGVVSYITLKIR
ncbi:MAG: DegQ family serine endoprotease [Thermodesulfovibrio sp.]|jgi:serine protease Do|uniref:DegQ family serine endoprotease n=1 Tax=Thermodesulfovibrio sp. 1176 TaxID=3043424 RepID=UPI002483001C|nr:DegQ family serine endoprotease [Thermodesulfovibrio sp. 1176]MDI1470950.1 DegQ family serine endoprotease [Thermodesulfovibrio sp. 1176]MDI6713800.1 DegQ family serine endoprotease [Thermodesulfovibrio sp.]